jgi:hypothetical protein
MTDKQFKILVEKLKEKNRTLNNIETKASDVDFKINDIEAELQEFRKIMEETS